MTFDGIKYQELSINRPGIIHMREYTFKTSVSLVTAISIMWKARPQPNQREVRNFSIIQINSAYSNDLRSL